MRIKKVKIQNQEIKLENLTLILGANSTGKTRLLEELFTAITGRERKTNFWGNIESEVVHLNSDSNIWQEHLHQKMENNQKIWFCPYTVSYTNNQSDGRQLNSTEYAELKNNPTAFFSNNSFLKRELIHYLPVDKRLDVPSSTQMRDPSNPPNDIINILWRNQTIVKIISSELRSLFNKKLLLMPHKIPIIELRLIDTQEEKPPPYELSKTKEAYEAYVKWLEENNISDIGTEGHGVRAFLHIMLTYSVPTNSVLMIDEPETHLYPSIKRKFGNAIGELAKKGKKQFICVTHDSDFLQGVFDSNCNTTVIKLFKKKKEHSLMHVQYNKKRYYKPSQKQSQFLQIPLLDCAILVEGATDRYIYENAISYLKLLENHEYRIISCGGKDSVTNPQRVAEDLKVPYVIILDADVFKGVNISHFERILKLKGGTPLLARIKEFSKKIKTIPNFKDKGIESLDTQLAAEFKELLQELKNIGIFIVSKGEVESWKDLSCSKSDFPELFVKQFKWRKSLFPELIGFLRGIESYLKGQLNVEEIDESN